jgi:hypothetical protein
VPIDPITNEPFGNDAEIIRPEGETPLTTEAKAGRYLVEAAIPRNDGPMFAEVYRNVVEIGRPADATSRANIKAGFDPDTCHFSDIVLTALADMTNKLVRIRIAVIKETESERILALDRVLEGVVELQQR